METSVNLHFSICPEKYISSAKTGRKGSNYILQCRAVVLLLTVLEHWISGTRSLLVLMSSEVIVLALILVNKYSDTRTSTGMSKYSVVYLWCKGENHYTCEINSMTYHKWKVPN